MGRFALRHWTAILIILVTFGWAIFYLPNTPSFAIVELKHAIDARDGNAAALYVDFPSVVKHAGYEMIQSNEPSGGLGELVGKGAVDLFSKPMAAVLESWTKQKVENGAREVQIPTEAVAGALVILKRDGDTAYTRFRDRDGRVWEVRMERNSANGRWQIVEVKNVQQLLEKLKSEEANRSGTPGEGP